MTLKTSDFDYYLPEELIAQTPIEKRDNSRLMVIERKSGNITHKHFYDIIEYLNEGDALVLNNSRVIPARVYGKKEDTGANIEILLLKPIENKIYEVMVRPAKRLKEGSIVVFSEELKGKIILAWS